MASKRCKYCLSVIVSLAALPAFAQTNAQGNQSVVTIVGDAPETNNDPHDFINSNPYNENNAPQMQQQMTSQNIEPTLENGFHIRYELEQGSQGYAIEKPDTRVSSSYTASASSSSGGGSASVGKTKKHNPSIDERTFNTKKKLKRWLPKRKKRYHPHLCGRF